MSELPICDAFCYEDSLIITPLRREITRLNRKLDMAEKTYESSMALKERVIDDLQQRLDAAEVLIAANMHVRKCHDCGHSFHAKDGTVPYCLCTKCGSQDTRRV